MSQTPNVADTIAMLQSMEDAYAKAAPNKGEGAQMPWPVEGKHACWITDITVKPNPARKLGKRNGTDFSLPGVEVQFHYECLDPQEGQAPGQPFTWSGESIFLPNNPAAVPEDKAWINQMGPSRLRGALEVINGVSGGGLQAGLTSAIARVKSTRVVANVIVEKRISKLSPEEIAAGKRAYVNRTDYVNEIISR